MANLGDQGLSDRLASDWGTFGQTSDQLREEIAKAVAAYRSAPVWAYSAEAGAAHFKTLCAACHQPNQQDETIAPKLAGSGSKAIEYVVENVIDPNAVVGRDFQARIIVTMDGRVTSGLVEAESDTAITVRTPTGSIIIAKDQIEQMRVSADSFMPVGLLNNLNDRERIELFKYVMSL
jgi:putative heme-binding domain-containing protein